MIKGIKIVFLALVMVLGITTLGMAAAPSIVVNGNPLNSPDPAVIENGRTLVPLRAIFTALGQQVNWYADDRSITSGNIWLQVDNQTAYVGDNTVVLDVPAKIINGRTYVPLRFVAQSLGKEVKWVAESNRVEISDKASVTPTPTPTPDPGYSFESFGVLSGMSIKETNISPSFNLSTRDYTATVNGSTTFITLKAYNPGGSRIEYTYNGKIATTPEKTIRDEKVIPLEMGVNTITFTPYQIGQANPYDTFTLTVTRG